MQSTCFRYILASLAKHLSATLDIVYNAKVYLKYTSRSYFKQVNCIIGIKLEIFCKIIYYFIILSKIGGDVRLPFNLFFFAAPQDSVCLVEQQKKINYNY
jgi:hypothetical protein